MEFKDITDSELLMLYKLEKNNEALSILFSRYQSLILYRIRHFGFKAEEFEDLAQHLEGPTALAVCKDDATAAARVLYKFAKTADALEVKGGIVDGTYYDEAGLKQLANIPSREVLLSKLLGSMQSPIANFARVIKQIAEKDEEAA